MQNKDASKAFLSNETAAPDAAPREEREQPVSDTLQAVPPAIQPRRCPPEPAELKEIARRGWELYEQSIRAQVEPQYIGKFMSIDIDTGEYAISDDPLVAALQLIDKNPAVRCYGVRIGFRAMYKI